MFPVWTTYPIMKAKCHLAGADVSSPRSDGCTGMGVECTNSMSVERTVRITGVDLVEWKSSSSIFPVGSANNKRVQDI